MQITERKEWSGDPELWSGNWQGGEAGISVIFTSYDAPGRGPKLHTHPYAETFIIRSGSAEFVVGEKIVQPNPGDIITVPPNMPHKFTSLGDDTFESINIHASGEFVTDWLE